MADPMKSAGVHCTDWAIGPMYKNAVIVLGIGETDAPVAWMELTPDNMRRLIGALQAALVKITLAENGCSPYVVPKKPS
jgi:hypothetical protein